MSEQLISKKELLELMDISYGQLYRWKRKKLIPEEWFIRKSVSTGQETYFPKDKIIERIQTIIELKDELSLDDLAYRFSNNKKDIKLTREYIKNFVSEEIVINFENIIEVEDIYGENNIFALLIFKNLIELGSLSLAEIREIVILANKDYEKIDNRDYYLIVKRKLGVCYYYVMVDDISLFDKDNGVELAKINLNSIIEEIKKIGL
ncbi:DUF4004 family protein [Clostridium isatidis]|uniref:DUF4004 domain-containing protein n=1 Tax=Clostridium isatidis TaxID=182773 RepID=A0A343JCD0_9CLOT|nr:DUF4004 family protein [Clostridium isatidis]ASW43188.1 hypothetical protein BEN51_06750 [Clostridium isatidis]NLZ33723.1 DUF4004 family protein [Clostridiales bacterium]